MGVNYEKPIFARLAAVQAELAGEGIAKGRKASFGRGSAVSYRGIDDVYNNVGPILAKHGILILPIGYTIDRVAETSSYTLTSRYQIVSCEGEFFSHPVLGIADLAIANSKAVPIALSCAYRDMLLQLFCIPLAGIDEADVSDSIKPVVAAGTTTDEELASVMDEILQAGTVDQLDGIGKRHGDRPWKDVHANSLRKAFMDRREALTGNGSGAVRKAAAKLPKR